MINISESKVLAIIPARGGSKRLPRKNILPLANRPLLAYSIDAAKQCSLITDIIVTSEDEEICELARKMGVEVICRPSELASDTISNEYVVEHALKTFIKNKYFPDYVVLLQPTSPLRTATHLQECLQSFLSSTMRSVVSVCPVEHHPGKCMKMIDGEIKPYSKLEDVEKRTQELEKVYRQNGAIYALKTRDFLEQLKFYQSPCLPYVMEIEDSIDIDSKLDLLFCECLLSSKNKNQMDIEYVS
ncbi:cytidylyltransferase domain-containing protein [Legionella cardiaca]|uniref:Acylneuraminate cytidylyltransferase family protein n=1 Tax=Legionella cardiaca TaxID=1071983 RepID=A0ABY8AN06_9GAMM|nr:acylneuraminate cytidylyltransferase family protein [Legionella cardiaca]WED41908.1 acylneuraminate cytidylyltransferase family protein [Legionella cardiaca]